MDLQELYRDIILEHSKNPRHFGVLEPCDCKSVGHNPLCGDKWAVYVRLQGEQVSEISFIGEGCAISKASASLMSENLRGQSVAECRRRLEDFHHVLTHLDADGSHLGELQALLGVREFPARVKCATLAWHTLGAALQHQAQLQVS